MQEKTLSSDWTLWTKFIFPSGWILGFGSAAILLGSRVINDAMPALPAFGFFVAWILATALVFWMGAGLKRVRMDERQLYVSNYFRETSIPFTAISDVKQNRWLSTCPITIYFRDATDFGDKVKFMPKKRLQFWRIDPIVNELKQLAGLAD